MEEEAVEGSSRLASTSEIESPRDVLTYCWHKPKMYKNLPKSTREVMVPPVCFPSASMTLIAAKHRDLSESSVPAAAATLPR